MIQVSSKHGPIRSKDKNGWRGVITLSNRFAILDQEASLRIEKVESSQSAFKVGKQRPFQSVQPNKYVKKIKHCEIESRSTKPNGLKSGLVQPKSEINRKDQEDVECGQNEDSQFQYVKPRNYFKKVNQQYRPN